MAKTELNSFGQPVGKTIKGWKPCSPLPPLSKTGRYCRIAPFQKDRDGSGLWDAICEDDGRMWSYMPIGPFQDRNIFDVWCGTIETSADPMFHTLWDEDGHIGGVASFLRMDPDNGVAEVGYITFAPRLQRSRAATEAMALMMGHVFDAGYRRYEWKCNVANAASRRAAERLGFSFEGVFRQAAVVKGRNRDTAWYSLLDSEWPAQHRAFERWLDPENFDVSGRQSVSLQDLRD